MNGGIINSVTRLHLVGCFYRNVLKCGSLNPLEPLGPVQACNGIALPFYLYKVDVLVSECSVRVSQ